MNLCEITCAILLSIEVIGILGIFWVCNLAYQEWKIYK